MFALRNEPSMSAQLVGKLRSEILSGRLPAGERMKSMRALSAEFGVSKQVVESAFDVLEAEGLIEKRQGRGGTRVKHAKSARDRKVKLFLDESVFEWQGQDHGLGFYPHLALMLQLRLAAKGFIVVPVSVPDKVAVDIELPLASDTKAIFLGRHIDLNADSFRRQLAHASTGLYVFIDSRIDAPRAVSIVGDNHGGGVLAGRHLLDQGVRRLAFSGSAAAPNHDARSEGFIQALQERGVRIPEEFYWHSLEETISGLTRSRHELDGVFFAADWLAVDTTNHFRHHGVELQRGLRMVSFDNTAWMRHAGLDIPAVDVDRQQMAEKALAALEREAAPDNAGGGASSVITVRTTLFVPESHSNTYTG